MDPDFDLPNAFTALDREWRAVCRRHRRSDVLRRWRAAEPALANVASLDDLIPPSGVDREELVDAMVRLHRMGDDLAGRALLQLVVPGLVFLAARWRHDIDRPHDGGWEVVGAAAIYIARLGRGEIVCGATVAGNLLRTVNRQLIDAAQKARLSATPSGSSDELEGGASVPYRTAMSAEEVALSGPVVLDTIRTAVAQGDITPVVARTLAHVCAGATVIEACRRADVGIARYYRHRRRVAAALKSQVLPEAV